jgi:hypothetical protein
MEKIPDEIKIKIIEKIRGMVYVRKLEQLPSEITISEFKYIITRYSIGKKQWFQLARELEKNDVIKLHGWHPIEVLRSNIKIQSC